MLFGVSEGEKRENRAGKKMFEKIAETPPKFSERHKFTDQNSLASPK